MPDRGRSAAQRSPGGRARRPPGGQARRAGRGTGGMRARSHAGTARRRPWSRRTMPAGHRGDWWCRGSWSSRRRYARPSSRSSAVWTLSRDMPSRTIAKATVGWMPTMTFSAPRSRAAWARWSRVREPKESMTSRAATSMMTPRARWVPICSTRSCWNWTISWSFSASWIEAIRYSPCRRIETSISTIQSVLMVVDRVGLGHLEPEQAFRLFDAALQVPDGVHLAKVDADGHQGLGDLWGQAGEDHAGPHQP